MNWKRFLKPTKKKILLTIALLTIGMLAGLNSICFWPEHTPECSISILDNIFGVITLMRFAIYLFFATTSGFIAFVIIPLYYYLVSCVIIALYVKLKK